MGFTRTQWIILSILTFAVVAVCCIGAIVVYSTNSLAAVGLPKCNAKDFLKTSSDTIDKFYDATRRAEATSRIALSPIIGDMQQIRRDYKNLQHPSCADPYFQYIVAGMDDTIEAYISFMGQEGDWLVNVRLTSAANNFQRAKTELAILNNPTFVNIPTPTLLPTPTIAPVPTLRPLPTRVLSAPTLTPPPNVPGYTRSNPIPLGKSAIWTGQDSEQIEFTLLQFFRGQDAWNRIKSANQFNKPAPSGAEYMLFKVRARLVKAGKESSVMLGDAYFVVVTSDGKEAQTFKGQTVVPPDPPFLGRIYANGSLEGWIAFTVTAGDSHPLLAYGQAIFPNEMRVWLDTR
jgi:hypothetical protein